MHQQLGRIGRDLPATDEMQVVDFDFIDRLLDAAALDQEVRQAIGDRCVQRLVQMAFAHVGIDQYDPLPA
ncbi:hypothetical protein D3C75_1066150 [compost metagenome]